MLRIALGGFCHETNAFGNTIVSDEFLKQNSREGEAFYQQYHGSYSYLGGFFDEAEELGVEAVPIFTTNLKPSGPCTESGVEYSRDRLVSLLLKEHEKKHFDGIALFMHGAGATEKYPDIEGEILGAIRSKLGNEIPIGVVLDLHGNITPKMAEYADILMGCKQYPHSDEYDSGRQMFRKLCTVIQKGKKPFHSLIRLPWLMAPAVGVTLSGSAGKVKDLLYRLEEETEGLLAASFFQGFPYADCPMAGVSVITCGETLEIAEKAAKSIAEFAWNLRHEFTAPLYSAKEAVDHALAAEEKPALIHESSDNPGGGTPGDGTHLLRELIRRDICSAFGFICDPEIAEAAAKAGVGARIDCLLGGKRDSFHGSPIELKGAYVSHVSDGGFIRKSKMGYRLPSSLGTTVCLQVGNVSIVVGTQRTQTFDDGPFVTAGVDWRQKDVLALKSSQHFKGWWKDHVKTIVPCESPGIQTSNLSLINFRRADTSYYPLGDPQWPQPKQD